MKKTQWLDLMTRLKFEDNLVTYTKLQNSYNEKHRHYHNNKHIEATLKHLENAKGLAEDYEAIEIAIWFHDAIYKIFSSSNESDSANWAAKFLKENNASDDLIKKIHKLIMATLHNATSIDNDEQLLVDIDLSILGSSPEVYSEFEKQVRKEYRLIPDFIYKRKRKEVLNSFLERKRIYSHNYFFNLLESNAKNNLKNAINHL